jgi:hypothetical protein
LQLADDFYLYLVSLLADVLDSSSNDEDDDSDTDEDAGGAGEEHVEVSDTLVGAGNGVFSGKVIEVV